MRPDHLFNSYHDGTTMVCPHHTIGETELDDPHISDMGVISNGRISTANPQMVSKWSHFNLLILSHRLLTKRCANRNGSKRVG